MAVCSESIPNAVSVNGQVFVQESLLRGAWLNHKIKALGQFSSSGFSEETLQWDVVIHLKKETLC